MHKLPFVSALLLSACLPAVGQRGDRGKEQQPDIFPIDKVPPAPVLSPEEALRSFQLESGFRIELVAAEPLLEDPVAIRFDADGRLWAVELRGYMPNIDGVGEDAPVGRIVILEDTDGDGKMDSSKVFLDGLNQVRAISFVKGGLLYCEPPNLWFVERLDGDRPGDKVLVDAGYARGGNVEHKANGLVPALDNWLYSAKSDRRYRFRDGTWSVGKTEGRGQWGIAQDDYGRLFYNSNSSGLRGDSVPPSLLMRNPHFSSKDALNRGIGSNRIFSIRPNAGINRGYKPGMLDDQGRLRNFTGASGPCIYRGEQFPPEFAGNGFTPEPCGNLVKRFIVEDKGGRVGGRDAYDDRDFLASTDERFRPVSVDNGPDGCLYVVDMYRGIIQHKTYVTSYLRRHILHRDLDKPIGLGRIYRIVAEGSKPSKPPQMSKMSVEALARQLRSQNGWVRDTAQRLLVERGDPDAVAWLEKLAGDREFPKAQIHALWTLEGMGQLSSRALVAAKESSDDSKVLAAVALLAPRCDAPEAMLEVLAELAENVAPDLQLALALGLGQIDGEGALLSLAQVVESGGKDKLIRDAAISGLAGRERQFHGLLESRGADPGGVREMLAVVATKADAGDKQETHLAGGELQQFHRGKELYSRTCFACHGADGEGLVPLAPPLVKSEWVTGRAERLAHIVLNGLQGPIEVRGKRYAPPEIQPIMPGLGASPEFDDASLAAIMTYVRNAWGNSAAPVSAKQVSSARKSAKQGIYTPEELLGSKE